MSTWILSAQYLGTFSTSYLANLTVLLNSARYCSRDTRTRPRLNGKTHDKLGHLRTKASRSQQRVAEASSVPICEKNGQDIHVVQGVLITLM